MAKLKANNDINLLVGTLKSGSVIDNTSTDPKKIIFKDSSGAEMTIDADTYKSQFTEVGESTPVNVNFQKIQIVEDVQGGLTSFAKSIQMGGTIGTLAGLGLAFYRKSGIGGYIGWSVLFGVTGAIVGGVIGGRKAAKNLKNANV